VFIDTSAFVAIVLDEPEAVRMLTAISKAASHFTSGVVQLETSMVVATRSAVSPMIALRTFDAILEQAAIETRPLTDNISRHAVAAFDKYGKGRGHPAQLNLADCLSYAYAKAFEAPILFKGSDFRQTDLEIAEY
jgi:ribonuclease VapC